MTEGVTVLLKTDPVCAHDPWRGLGDLAAAQRGLLLTACRPDTTPLSFGSMEGSGLTNREDGAASSVRLSIREATLGDATHLSRFHGLEYGWTRTVQQFEWEFTANDALVVVAEANGRIMGTQALLPAPGLLGGRKALTAKSEFVLVDQSARGMGVFQRLAQRCFDEADARGFELIWGFTDATDAHGRAGFQVGPRMTRFVLPLRTSRAGVHALRRVVAGPHRRRAAEALSRAPSYLVRSLLSGRTESSPDPSNATELVALWVELSDAMLKQWPASFTVDRDPDYLRWRIVANPWGQHIGARSSDGRALAVAMVQGERAALVDVVTATGDQEGVQEAIGSLTASLRKRNVSVMEAWDLDGHPIHGLTRGCLRRLGAVSRGIGNAFVWRGQQFHPEKAHGLLIPYLLSEGVGWPT